MKKILFTILLLLSMLSMGQSTDISNGLVAYFPLDHDVKDYSPMHINGTNFNATPVSSIVTGHYNFNGTNAYIYAGNDSRSITDSLTVSVWVKTTATDSQWVVGHYDHIPDKGFHIYIDYGHALLAGRDGSNTYYRLQGNQLINDGEWHHIVGLIAGNKWTLIVDCEIKGVLITNAINPSYDVNSQPFCISIYPQYQNGTDPTHFTGSIDEIRVYNRVLSICEISELHNYSPIIINTQSSNLLDVFNSQNKTLQQINFQKINIYPNPAEHYFKVSLTEQSSDYASLQVFDLNGKQIIEKSFVNETSVSTEKLKPDTYIVQVIDGEQNYSKKLIVK